MDWANTLSVAPVGGSRQPRVPWVPYVLLVLCVFLAYSRTWHAGFIWDDDSHLTANPAIVGPGGFLDIWSSASATYLALAGERAASHGVVELFRRRRLRTGCDAQQGVGRHAAGGAAVVRLVANGRVARAIPAVVGAALRGVGARGRLDNLGAKISFVR